MFGSWSVNAPVSCRSLPRTPSTLASASTAISSAQYWSRSCTALVKYSRRSSVHLIERMRRAAVLPQLLLEHIRGPDEGCVNVAERHLVGGDDVACQLAADRRRV